MQVTGMLHGAKLLQFAGFPTSEVLGPAASEGEIKDLISRHGSVFVKPVFKGGVGKKGKAGLLGRAKDLQTALKEKERLYFAEHRVGNNLYKAVQRSAGAVAVGPVLQGLGKPVNDLSRGATVADIVTTVAVTAAQVRDEPRSVPA